jgi:outer membrane murein-binding lipoprotein Lpp
MANKTLERGKKSLLIIFAIFLGISAFLSGCSSKVEENPEAQRIKDSASVYSALNSAYIKYQDALKAFQEDQKSSSQKSFEKSVSLI